MASGLRDELQMPGPAPDPRRPVLQVTATTWARESHDLFDYESRNVTTKTFEVHGPAQICRHGTEVSAQSGAADECLLRVAPRAGGFGVERSERHGARKLWHVVRGGGPGHPLGEGDTFKLGRFKLKVRQVVPDTGQDAVVQPELDDAEARCEQDPRPEDADGAPPKCRICLLEQEESEVGDPLISPCACRGGVRHIHVGCVRQWIKTKLKFPDASADGSYSYNYKSLQCELCQTTYAAFVNVNGERVPLLPIPRTQPPFIVLENQQPNNRGVHVISLANKKQQSLGRGHESDVRISDVSISRCHAHIRYSNGSFVLEDHSSKFGTLVLIKKAASLEVGHSMSIQVGRTVLQVKVRQDDEAIAAVAALMRQTGLA